MINDLLIIGIFVLLGGGLIFAMGAIGFKHDKTRYFIKRCTKEVEAVVDGFDDENIIVKRQKTYIYHNKYAKTKTALITYMSPIFLFTDNNIEYRASYFRPMERNLSMGQKFKIKYNPENPYEYIVIGDKSLQMSSRQTQYYGIFMMILGIMILLYNFNIINIKL